jgi:poly-gamma-glutamate synthesis protein (capsule biosynthesis protein)
VSVVPVESRLKRKKNQQKKFKTILLVISITVLIASLSFGITYTILSKRAADKEKVQSASVNNINTNKDKITNEDSKDDKIATSEPSQKEIIVTSVGDCTIGHDTAFSYSNSLPAVLQKNNDDFSYFFKNVSDIFKNDDITTANLETTFTESTVKAEKQFTFKAPPKYAKALTLGSIEGVNISNNHIRDYLDAGFKDTISALKAEKINYFGEGYKWNTEVKGVKFGFLGYKGYYYDKNFLNSIKSDIASMKAENRIVIINFHWGDENSYSPNSTQKYLAHYAVDNGADIIIGHHPHVIEGLEQYKGKIICYSLGNFCFGGNVNPSDKDTFIMQTKFIFKDNKLTSYGVKAIPCSISSVNYINDYCPTPMVDNSKKNLLDKINSLSINLKFALSDGFSFIDVNN